MSPRHRGRLLQQFLPPPPPPFKPSRNSLPLPRSPDRCRSLPTRNRRHAKSVQSLSLSQKTQPPRRRKMPTTTPIPRRRRRRTLPRLQHHHRSLISARGLSLSSEKRAKSCLPSRTRRPSGPETTASRCTVSGNWSGIITAGRSESCWSELCSMARERRRAGTSSVWPSDPHECQGGFVCSLARAERRVLYVATIPPIFFILRESICLLVDIAAWNA